MNRAGWYALVSQYAFPLLGVVVFFIALTYGLFWLGMIGLLAGIVWPAIRSLVWPPALGVTVSGSNLVYEFRSEKLSQEFRELNETSRMPD
jgi:hypothetical protein